MAHQTSIGHTAEAVADSPAGPIGALHCNIMILHSPSVQQCKILQYRTALRYSTSIQCTSAAQCCPSMQHCIAFEDNPFFSSSVLR